jgi:hypothetical protein
MSGDSPFFIVGSARSGTTMLRLIMNAHGDVAVPPESRFITELWSGEEEVEVRPLLDTLSGHPRFVAWDVPIEAVAEELRGIERAKYTEVMAAPYRAYARLQGKRRWGDKTPRYVEDIPLLARLWPDARFVHLVRDGRNVALSYADVPFGPKNVARAAALWSRRVSEGIAVGRTLGHRRYVEVRYEDLVEDAEGEVKEICDFLEIDFDPGMLDYTERARGAILPRAAQYNPHVTQEPISEVRSWERDMPHNLVEIFEAVGGPTLSELGYERRYPHPGTRARIGAALGRAHLPVGVLRSSKPRD